MNITIRSDIKGRFVRFNRMMHRPKENTNLEVGQTVTATPAKGGGVWLKTAGGRVEIWHEGEPHTYGTRYKKQNRPPNGGFVGRQML